MKKISLRTLAETGALTALICVLGPLSIPLPFSPAPIAFANLAIFFAVYLLGTKRGLLCTAVYLLIGFVGVPVFAGFTGGAQKLLGPTGGYLVGYLPMALIIGLFVDRWADKKPLLTLPGYVLGSAACYALGSLWLAKQMSLTFSAAMMMAVVPYLPGDAAKIALTLLAAPIVRRRLAKRA